MNRITGSSAFLSLLRDEGVSHIFGNPGTTELPIMDAMTRYPDLTYVLGLQESIVVAMADGFSRSSGRLSACNVHVAPGLGNALGAIYNAKFFGSPMIITAGQQEQGHGLTEPMLYEPLVPMAAPLVKWAIEVTRLEDLPRIVHRAAKVALTAPTGPVFVSLPGDVLNQELGLELGAATRVDTASRPTAQALGRLADRLLAAESPVIISGHEVATSDALAEAASLAELLGAPVYQQTVPYGAHFPSEHPAFMGALTRDQQQVHDALKPHDLLLSLGCDALRMSVWSEVDPLPSDMSVVQIGQRDWDMGKNYPAETAIRCDVKVTLAELNTVLAAKIDPARAAHAETAVAALGDRNWRAKCERLRAKTAAAAVTRPIDPNWLMMQLVDTLPADAIVVDEGLITSRALLGFLPFRTPTDYHGLASGGIGWAIAGAVGISLAQPGRPILAIIGDGSSLYSIQALWTAAHHKLPITYVIANNGGYRIIKERLLAFHANDRFIGMDLHEPAIDFVGLATALGVPAQRITDPGEIAPAVRRALASDGPHLLDVVVEDGFGG